MTFNVIFSTIFFGSDSLTISGAGLKVSSTIGAVGMEGAAMEVPQHLVK
jgi:hypothetical protein